MSIMYIDFGLPPAKNLLYVIMIIEIREFQLFFY